MSDTAVIESTDAEKNAQALTMVDGYMATNINADREIMSVDEVTNLMLDLRNLLSPPTKGGESEPELGEPTPG